MNTSPFCICASGVLTPWSHYFVARIDERSCAEGIAKLISRW
jgi:hypothetical protein